MTGWKVGGGCGWREEGGGCGWRPSNLCILISQPVLPASLSQNDEPVVC